MVKALRHRFPPSEQRPPRSWHFPVVLGTSSSRLYEIVVTQSLEVVGPLFVVVSEGCGFDKIGFHDRRGFRGTQALPVRSLGWTNSHSLLRNFSSHRLAILGSHVFS